MSYKQIVVSGTLNVDPTVILYTDDDGVVWSVSVDGHRWDDYQAWLAVGNHPDDPDIPSLLDQQAQAWTNIKTERDRRTSTGGYQAAGYWFNSDTPSRIQIMALVMLGANVPSGLQWKTMDGTFVTMTSTLAQQVFAAASASDQAIFAYAVNLQTQVNNSTNPLQIDIMSGWPKIFGE